MIPKAQHLDSLPFQETRPLLIFRSPFWKAVAATIEFDCKLCLRAVEIEEVNAAGILPTKLELVEAAMTQQTPQAFFGIGGICSELAREVACCGGAGTLLAVLWCPPPHPGPLPRWGRGGRKRFGIVGAVRSHIILYGASPTNILPP
jgi:hypothetical protein